LVLEGFDGNTGRGVSPRTDVASEEERRSTATTEPFMLGDDATAKVVDGISVAAGAGINSEVLECPISRL